MPKQTTLWDVLTASKGLPPATPLAAIWGRKLAGGYTVETYTGALPVTLEDTVAGDLVSYKIWGNSGGVGRKKTNLAEGEQLLEHAAMGSDGHIVSSAQSIAFRLIPIVEGREYSIVNIYGAEASKSANFYAFFEELPQIGSVSYNESRYSFKTASRTFVAPITGYLATSDYYPMYDEQHSNLIPLEVYEGNASPYYLPIVSASETTDIYVGRTALDKGEYVDYEEQKLYKLKEVHEDTVTINGIVWDILGYDHDEVYKEDDTLAQHTVTIQTHDCVDNLQFDAREALFVFPDGLAAGSYTFTIKAHPGFPSDVDKSITFTLTQAIPSGGQLVVSQSYNASFTTGNIASYTSPSAGSPIETVKMTEGDTGTSLGDVTNAVTGNANGIQRAFLGSNKCNTSALKQLLNSDKAAGTFWEPQTPFDRPPSWVANAAGFLYGMDTDFVSVLGKAKKRTALNTVSDGGGYEDSIEKVFLLSRTEVYAGKENSIDEGSPYAFYEDYSDLSSPSTGNDTNRVKYLSSEATYWWLRSANTSTASNVRFINLTGSSGVPPASNSYGVAPACCVVLDDISQNTWLKDHFLKPTDPPEPLPQIPTFAGRTIIDYSGEIRPEKVEFVYNVYKKSK